MSKETYHLNVLKESVDLSDDDMDPPAQIYYQTDHEEPSPETLQILKQRETLTNFAFLPICTVMLSGMIFGICLNKGRIFEPNIIVNQMKFTNCIMLKLFLSAAGSSALAIALSSYLYPAHFAFARSKHRSIDNILIVICGGFILGIGMTVSGSCPGMVLVQCGAGVPNSYITIFGLLFGAFLSGCICALIPVQLQSKPSCHIEYIFIDEYFAQNGYQYINYKVLCIIFGMLCWCVVIVFEVLTPWRSELTIQNEFNCNFITCGAWPPHICGFIIGMLQIPLISVLGNTLGCSSSYIGIMSQWLRYCNESTQNIFIHFRNEMDNWWQIVFVLAVIFGSWIAVALTEHPLNVVEYPYDNIEGLTRMRSLCGGIFMIFGANIARGCSSGHGLSGFGLLSVSSMFVIASMFAGGIVTARFM